jgi:hypothetical protein
MLHMVEEYRRGSEAIQDYFQDGWSADGAEPDAEGRFFRRLLPAQIAEALGKLARAQPLSAKQKHVLIKLWQEPGLLELVDWSQVMPCLKLQQACDGCLIVF